MLDRIKIAALEFTYTNALVCVERSNLTTSIASRKLPKPSGKKKLLIDISVLAQGDAKTGIQRVVRALLAELTRNPPDGYTVRPIYATSRHGYRYIENEADSAGIDNNSILPKSRMVCAANGDVFLGLDLATNVLPIHQKQIERWKFKGAKIYIFVYDLLPVLNPEWFHGRTTRRFYRWLRSIAVVMDGAICISCAVEKNLQKWMSKKYGISKKEYSSITLPMGADVESSMPSAGLPDNAKTVLKKISESTSVLMVGTIEPRKGYEQTLNSFDLLWMNHPDLVLVIVGKAGWKIGKLAIKLRTHEQYGKRLFWIEDASDEYLECIYKSSSGLLIASKGEGFGLPIIEALKHGKKVLARDLPVFREILSKNITYFDKSANSVSLANDIVLWIDNIKASGSNVNWKFPTWSDSVLKLNNYLKIQQDSGHDST